MTIQSGYRWTALIALLILSTSCENVKFTRVPPGQSVEVALAKKATPVPQPVEQPQAAPVSASADAALPAAGSTETVADFFTLGNLCMQQGRFPEAIEAFEKVLKLDATFSEAWNNLALCYQNIGQDQKALETFRKFKSLSAR